MTPELAALVAQTGQVAADRRQALATRLGAALPAGCVLLETCHRVELYGPADVVDDLMAEVAADDGSRRLAGDDVARHVIAVAVGRDSSVLGEDQILHQLRAAVRDARRRGPLAPSLDHLLDVALRAGRRARTWLPAQRPSLADVAVAEALAGARRPDGSVLVVGAGEMGRLAARAAARAGRPVVVASRSHERAAALAAQLGGRPTPFATPPAPLAEADAVVVALSGPWPLAPEGEDALAASGATVVDLSSPPAVPGALAARLGARFVSVDALATRAADRPAAAVAARLDAYVEATLDEYRRWLALEPEREAARELADRGQAARRAELAELWQRVPSLDPAARREVERMAERLTARLLRDPIERLRADDDGRHRQAARELFGL